MVDFTIDVPVVPKRCSKVVKLETGFNHKSLKVIEFIMELTKEVPKEDEACVEASSQGLLHSYELMSG